MILPFFTTDHEHVIVMRQRPRRAVATVRGPTLTLSRARAILAVSVHVFFALQSTR